MAAAQYDAPATVIIRPARATDRDAVVAFCQRIWEGSDYVDNEVFDDWLNQVPGPMLVGELAGQPVALAKVAVHPDGHAWFQGLRVDPDVQGQGIAHRLHEASELAAAAAGASPWALLTADAGPTAVQRLCDAHGWTIQGRTRYLHVLAATDDTPCLAVTPTTLGDDDARFLEASLAHSPTLTALAGWYTLDWECEPFTIDKLHAHLRAGQVWALPSRRAWGIVTTMPANMADRAPWLGANGGGDAWWAFAEGNEPDLTTLARALHQEICHRRHADLKLHVPTGTPWDHACQQAALWRDPAHPPKQFRLYTKLPANP